MTGGNMLVGRDDDYHDDYNDKHLDNCEHAECLLDPSRLIAAPCLIVSSCATLGCK